MKKITAIMLASTLTTCSMLAYADNIPAMQDPNGEKNIAVPSAGQPATKIGELTGNFTLTTNYMFRGITQTSNTPAVQGGLTYKFEKPGIYFTLWGSNVNFLDPRGTNATVEFDTVAGISNSIGEHFTYDINIDRYNYPESDASYNEAIANFGFYFLTAQVAFSSNVYNLHGNGTYYNIGATYDIPARYFFNLENVNIKGGIGRYNFESSTGLSSYNDYNLQISKVIDIYTLALLWTDTNGESVDPTSFKNSHFVASVTANF